MARSGGLWARAGSQYKSDEGEKMKRVVAGLAAAAVLALGTGYTVGVNRAPLAPLPVPAFDDGPDGRTHTCGLVTEEGVTENLGAYRERCGTDV